MAADATLQIEEGTLQILHELAEHEGVSTEDVLVKAVEAYRRWQVLEATNDGYAAMRVAPEGWGEKLKERAIWDAALGDRLD